MQTLLFPLRGVLKCAYCTCQYTASLKKGHEYYYCTNGKRNCEAHTRYLRSEPATKLVSKALAKVRIDEELIEIMYDAKREMSASTHSYAEAVRARLQGQLGTLEAQELKAFEDSSSGILRQELYEHMMLKIKKSRILIKKELGELHLKEGISTLEPIRDAFLRASTMQKLFLKASPEQKKMLSAEVLWNLLVKDGETQEVQYKSFYQVLANAPKKAPLEIMLRD